MLEKTGNTAGELVHDLLLAHQHGGNINTGTFHANAMHAEMIPRLGKFVATIQQCLGRNATYVQAGSSQPNRALVVKPLFYTGGGEAELCGLDSGYIARGTSADYHYIVFV